MRIEIPSAVDRIIKKLNENGFEAFAVGGCVRDTLLGRNPEDWDITTSAKPEEVKQIFPRTIDTGIQHGTVTIMDHHVGYEVTTYRIDGEYEDGRHPKSVAFTSNLKEDLRRRDFTINAMAYSHETGIVDEFGGMEDLDRTMIRCVGNPIDRFTEDALRILRAIRFSAQLGFAIEKDTYEAIGRIAPNMEKVSKERIQVELTKLLLSAHPDKMSLVFETGISPYISKAFHEVPKDGMKGAEKFYLEPKKHLRWAAFLRRSGEKMAVRVLRDLKLDNDTIFKTGGLVKWCYVPLSPEKTEVRRMMSRMDEELFDDLISMKKFCCLCDEQAETDGMALNIKESLSDIERAEQLAKEIREAGECLYLKQLAVTGKDLIASGMKPGPQLGITLQNMLEDVLEHPDHNQREYLLKNFS